MARIINRAALGAILSSVTTRHSSSHQARTVTKPVAMNRRGPHCGVARSGGRHFARFATCLGIAAAVTLPVAQGSDFTWQGAAGNSGNWSVATHWLPIDGPPNSTGDTATINLTGPAFTVTLDEPTSPSIPLNLAAFTFDAANGTLTPLSGQSRTIAIASGGTLDLLQGTTGGDLTFEVTSADIDIGSSSAFMGPAAFRLQGPGNTLATADDALPENRPFTISANSASGTGTLLLITGGGAFTIADGGQFDVEVDDGAAVVVSIDPPFNAVVNRGTFTVDGVAAAGSGSATLEFELDNREGGRFEVERPTLLGFTAGTASHANRGRMIVNDTLMAVGDFANQSTGTLVGAGTLTMVTATFANDGEFDPGINVVGSMTNSATARIPIDIAGTSAGSFDQLDISSSLTLAGTLELRLRGGFAPSIGDRFQIVDSGGLSGAFATIVPLLLPSTQAFELTTRGGDMNLEIVAPTAHSLTSGAASVTFGDGTAYDAAGAAPDTTWSLELKNVPGTPQSVKMVSDATVQSATLEGTTAAGTIELVIPADRFLGASHEVVIEDGGTLRLAADNARVFTQQVTVQPGGTLEGIGGVAADAVNRGVVRPGLSPGELDVEGDYVQLEGVLEIEIGGNQPGEFDTLNVDGQVTLDAKQSILEVELVDLGEGTYEPRAGDAFEIITAGGGLNSVFAIVLLPDLMSNDLSWEEEYGSDALILGVLFKADFDGDGDVDGQDFLIWQQNFGTMTGASRGDGDADGDGDVDGNDFLVWQTQMGQRQGSGNVTPVPAPITLLLSIIAAAGLACRRQRTAVPHA